MVRTMEVMMTVVLIARMSTTVTWELVMIMITLVNKTVSFKTRKHSQS